MSTVPFEPLPYAKSASNLFDWREWLRRLGPFIGLAFVFAVFSSLTFRTFVTVANVKLLLQQTSIVGIAALGMTLIIISGGIDLSVGSNVAFCAVIVARLLQYGVSPVLAVAGGIIAGTFVGILIGGLITGVRLSPFIATLGIMGAMRGTAIGSAGQTSVIYMPTTLRGTWIARLMANNSPDWRVLPIGVWIMIVLAVIMAATLRYTKFGRHVFAIGSNEQTARLCGVNVWKSKLIIYALGGALAAVAALLNFSQMQAGDSTTADGLELDVIAAVVIGGASLSGGEGTILGSIAGALMMGAVANGCSLMGYDNWVQKIVTGCIIIVAASLDRLRHTKS
jgi:ribose transport system permease protein